MSHFSTVVLIPKTAKDPEEYVKFLIEKYDENKETPEYWQECYCVHNSWRYAHDIMDKERITEAHKQHIESMRGKMQAFETKVWNLVKDKLPEDAEKPWMARVDDFVPSVERVLAKAGVEVPPEFEQFAAEEQETAKEWFASHRNHETLKKQLEEQDPAYGKADPGCEECSGSGKNISTYNPFSKWDWWQIGGRWSGYFDPDYNPEEDESNFETCFVCGGTGMRSDALGQQRRESDPDFTCNGCGSKPGPPGVTVKWPTHWVQHGNITTVAHWIELIEEGEGDLSRESVIPYAMVTPDGIWHAKGEMGWFGMSHDEIDQDDWDSRVKEIAKAVPNTLAVIVDCHI